MKALRMLVLLLLAAALCGFAASPATDCPPGSPDCPLEPPQTIEINPHPRSADGELAPVEAPGALTPVQAVIPMPPPTYVDVVPLPEGAPYFETLDVDMRYQGEGDVSCGVQALGMALEGLGAPAPASSALMDFLQQNGMFYDFGTGVEELAYAAQAHGYGGAYAFHNWDMGMLADEIAAGHPVVAALGANGEGQPGHFVTVTGISPDGQWVAFNDPTLGEQRMPIDEFAALWALQGNSGVRVALDAPVTSSGEMDLLPWVALAAGVMALITQFPWGQRREGIGGALAKDLKGEDVVRVVPRPAVEALPPPRRPAAPRNGDRPLAQPNRPPEPDEPPDPASPSRIAEEVSLVGGGVTEDVEGLLVHRVLPATELSEGDDTAAGAMHASVDPDFIPPPYDTPPLVVMPGADEGWTEGQMLAWAWAFGLHNDKHPDIYDYFNPCYMEDPTGIDDQEVCPQVLHDAVMKLYAMEGDLLELASHLNNPLNYWTVNPISYLEGDEARALASRMSGAQGNGQMRLFLREVGADPDLAWNYEPFWLQALMWLNPDALMKAQVRFIDFYSQDPDIWDLADQGDLAGTE
jgi:hypothetical protein